MTLGPEIMLEFGIDRCQNIQCFLTWKLKYFSWDQKTKVGFDKMSENSGVGLDRLHCITLSYNGI